MQAPKKIAVAGATGRVGHQLVDVLSGRGHDVVEISRSQGVDVITAEGLDVALEGVDLVIDAATGPEPEEEAATRFFTTSAHNLMEVAGPREESFVDAATLFVARRGEPLKVEGVSIAEDPNTPLYEGGALLPGADAILGGPTFEEWLEDQA